MGNREKNFDEFGSLCEFMEKGLSVEELKSRYNARNEEWMGESFDEIMTSVFDGNTSCVSEAERIIDELDFNINVNGLVYRWDCSPVGAYPNVPAFLAGDPMSMWAKDQRNARSCFSEINIYYSLTCSASFRKEPVFKRGVVALASVLALSRVRPINVYMYGAVDKKNALIKLRTNPMVLSETSYILSSVGFTRLIMYGYAIERHKSLGYWAEWYDHRNKDGQQIEKIRKALDATEDDIVIPPMYLDDDDMVVNPVLWINSLLDKYRD